MACNITRPKAKRLIHFGLILARDLAFFSVDFFSRDRGSDLGRVKSMDVLCRERGQGYLFNQVFGKTLRGKTSNISSIKPVPNSPYFPVANLKLYIALSSRMSIKLESGYLFRTAEYHGNIVHAPRDSKMGLLAQTTTFTNFVARQCNR